MHDTFSKAIAFAEIAENPCSCLRRSSQIALSSREHVLFPLHPEVVSDHAKIGQTAVLRRDFPTPRQNNAPPAHLVYLNRFAKLIEVLPARNSATCAKVVAFCSATCYNMPCPWGYSSVGRALEWHSRGQGFDSPYLHHLPKRSDRSGLFSFCLGQMVEIRECTPDDALLASVRLHAIAPRHIRVSPYPDGDRCKATPL